MDTALSLGTHFMLQSQHETGHFSYEFNWKLGKDLSDSDGGMVSPVREAGAAWGLALIALDYKQTNGTLPSQIVEAMRRTLDFFEKHSHLTENGMRLVAYPGLDGKLGDTGTLAILTLANIDYLRTEAAEGDERLARLKFLEGLLHSLRQSIAEDGRVRKSYSLRRGKFQGGHTPYYDGEALLALTKAAKYLGFTELWPDIDRLTQAGWRLIVRQGLQDQRDLPDMKGYYQWSSMAWHELLTSDHAEKYKPFQHRLVDYGLWMVEVHQVGKRTRNTGYAFEGLIPAYLAAEDAQLKTAQGILGCAIDAGMQRITGMQLGHPLASALAAQAPPLDRTRGGVQNAFEEPGLRIDTTQHQMHAVIMMKRLLSGRDLI
jgi:UDP-N-acetylmuramoyl-tripeptide--D-alanyl-D-alanine ligase